MKMRLVLAGFAIWFAATLFLRVRGQNLLAPNHDLKIAIIFALSFPLMALLIRRLCRGLPSREEQFAAAISILLPTLVLDPFSSVFFPEIFPNIAPQMAGVFGGWMLWCCAGGLIGVAIPQRARA
jgi:hypothetical protein